MNGPADSWPWECAEAPGFLPARHPFTNTKPLIHSSNRAISLRLGHDRFRDSTFYRRREHGASRPSLEHGAPTLPYVSGGALLAGGAAIVLGKKTRFAAILLATIISLFSFLHVPHIVTQPHNPGPWTSGFEVLALCGSALVPGQHAAERRKSVAGES